MTAYIAANDCFSALFADPEVAGLFDTEASIDGILDFERHLAEALGACGVASPDQVEAAFAAMRGWRPDLTAAASGFRADGIPVPEVVRQIKARAGKSGAPAIHIAATSQDVMDTATALALRSLSDMFEARLTALYSALDEMERRFGGVVLMGRTRMQAALEIPASHRIGGWKQGVGRMLERLPPVRCDVELVSYSGPVGLRDGPQGDRVVQRMAEALGLGVADRGSHTLRDGIAAYGNWLSLVSGTLGKMGADISLMAQQGIDEVGLSGGGASSAMPHKQNPVLAETLVTLSRFVAVQQGGLLQAMVHEQERSGAAWALEWMVLPLMAEATGAALNNAQALLGQITRIGPRT